MDELLNFIFNSLFYILTTESVLGFVILQLFLIIPYYFIFKFISKKLAFKSPRLVAWTSSFLTAVLFSIIFVFVYENYLFGKIRSKKFDSIEWKSNKGDRYKMVRDIINSKQLVGLKKSEVVKLLGEDFDDEGPCTCIGYYTYDPDQRLGVDPEVLEIVLNDDEVVTGVLLNAW
jgi:hypothetical protein